MNPYVDDENIRTFSKDVLSEELVWHRDRNDRTVTILEGEGWMFQYDNELPFKLSVGDVIKIDAYSYHRILKGDTDLKLKIEEQ